MADAKLSELPSAVTIGSVDTLYLVQGGSSKQIPWSVIEAAVSQLVVPGGGTTWPDFIAGEGVSASQCLYVAGDGTLALARANSLTTLPALFIAAESALGSTQVAVKGPGEIYDLTAQGTFTPGASVYVSDEFAGAWFETKPTTPGSYVQRIGIMLTSVLMLVWPDQQPVLIT